LCRGPLRPQARRRRPGLPASERRLPRERRPLLHAGTAALPRRPGARHDDGQAQDRLSRRL